MKRVIGSILSLCTGACYVGALAQLGDPNLQAVLAPLHPFAPSCPQDGEISCSNTTVVTDLCCFEAPGGLLLQTQFWDFDPAKGPNDSWTIHGLWPNNCDGSYDQNCDRSREYDSISEVLVANGAEELLEYMKEYWPDMNGNHDKFWKHEWDKHGTCLSTLRPTCLGAQGVEGADATAYFRSTVELFQNLPTYEWLGDAGILPSSDKTYTSAEIIEALQEASGGYTPAIQCRKKGKRFNLKEVHWYFNVQGSVMNGTYHAIDTPKEGNCPREGVAYPPKRGSERPTPPTFPKPGPSTPPTHLPAKAKIRALSPRLGPAQRQLGGLLSKGVWSTQVLATFRLSGTLSDFTLSSSKGDCGVNNGVFSCGKEVTPTKFSTVASGKNLLLAYKESIEFSSDGVPKGQTTYTVYTGENHGHGYTLAIFAV